MSTLDRIEKIEQDIKKLAEEVKSFSESKLQEGVQAANQVAEIAAQRVLALEQASAALGKTMAGLVKELHLTGVIDQEKIMDHIRDIDDGGDKEKIQSLLKAKCIARGDVVTPESLVVTSNSFINSKDPTKSGVRRQYCLVELPLPVVSPQLRKDLTGRKIGDAVPVSKTDSGVLVMTIKEIYNVLLPAEVVNSGEETEQETPPAPAAEPTPAPAPAPETPNTTSGSN
jgi:hypothetical protein